MVMKKLFMVLVVLAIILLSSFYFLGKGKMELKSSVFENNGEIPSKYTCDAENINPPLEISGIPEGAKSLVLIMDDPDIPDFVKQSRA